MEMNRYRKELECNKKLDLPKLQVEISNISKQLEEARGRNKESGAIPTNGGVEVAGIQNLRNHKANNLRTLISDLEAKLIELNKKKSSLESLNCTKSGSGIFNFLNPASPAPPAARKSRKSRKSRKTRRTRK